MFTGEKISGSQNLIIHLIVIGNPFIPMTFYSIFTGLTIIFLVFYAIVIFIINWEKTWEASYSLKDIINYFENLKNNLLK